MLRFCLSRLLLCLLLATLLCWALLNLWAKKEQLLIKSLDPESSQRHEVAALPPAGFNAQNSIVHQLIDAEIEMAGTRSMRQKGQLARQKYNLFMQQALKIEAPAANKPAVRAYFSALSSLIDQYFYYLTDRRLIDSFVAQGIDCDLRSFVFYDLAQHNNLDVSIVYAPFHAFVKWNDVKTGQKLYWETTVKGGEEAQIKKHKNLYLPSDDPHDYVPKNGSYAVEAYKLFSLFDFASAASNKKRQKMFASYKNYQGEVSSSKLYQLGLYEIEYLENQPHISSEFYQKVQKNYANSLTYSTYARAVAFEYFYQRGNLAQAKLNYLQLPPKFKDYQLRKKYAQLAGAKLQLLDLELAHLFSNIIAAEIAPTSVFQYRLHHKFAAVVLAVSLLLFVLSLIWRWLGLRRYNS